MTEEQAKAKWCPFVRYASHNGEGINRWVSEHDRQFSPEPARCIASACMAWRAGLPLWRQTTESGKRTHQTTNPGLRWVVGSNANEDPWLEAEEIPQGFCGLAGAPQ